MAETGVGCTTGLRGSRAGEHDVDESLKRRSTRGAETKEGNNTEFGDKLGSQEVSSAGQSREGEGAGRG